MGQQLATEEQDMPWPYKGLSNQQRGGGSKEPKMKEKQTKEERETGQKVPGGEHLLGLGKEVKDWNSLGKTRIVGGGGMATRAPKEWRNQKSREAEAT